MHLHTFFLTGTLSGYWRTIDSESLFLAATFNTKQQDVSKRTRKLPSETKTRHKSICFQAMTGDELFRQCTSRRLHQTILRQKKSTNVILFALQKLFLCLNGLLVCPLILDSVKYQIRYFSKQKNPNWKQRQLLVCFVLVFPIDFLIASWKKDGG